MAIDLPPAGDSPTRSPVDVETSLVVETFNYYEGTSLDSLRRSLHRACELAAKDGNTEVLLAEVTGDAKLAEMIAVEFPAVRILDAAGLGYDEAKARAATEARGRFVLYLDSDCIPDPGWFDAMLAPLRDGSAVATAGYARYGGGFFQTVCSVMDFGFLLPRASRRLGSYASNNSAFRRDVLLAVPEPDGPMRCRCYAHAQILARRGTPVRLVARAAVTHEPPALVRERLRQGYDMVAACWVNPELPETRWLKFGIAAAPLFYRRRVRLDWRTLRRHYRDAGLTSFESILARPLAAVLRSIDLVGMVAALALGPKARRFVDRTARPQAA
jgi:glycosyltransferase involved in cell wall biosynthesis